MPVKSRMDPGMELLRSCFLFCGLWNPSLLTDIELSVYCRISFIRIPTRLPTSFSILSSSSQNIVSFRIAVSIRLSSSAVLYFDFGVPWQQLTKFIFRISPRICHFGICKEFFVIEIHDLIKVEQKPKFKTRI